MISIIITSFKEPKTIGKAIECVIKQNIQEDYELIISAPDLETLKIAKDYQKYNEHIRIFKDPGKGKSYAINLLLKRVKGKLIVLTDGDVYISENSINEILKEFNDNLVGCVSGRPIPQENKNSKYGYWANFLFDSAHKIRKKLKNSNSFLECSGYLWAFRNNFIDKFPLNIAEDSIIPYMFFNKGYKITYAENAKVFVKNPDNWKDWIKQKSRTTKAHKLLKYYSDSNKSPRTKTFFNESKGIFLVFSYPKSLKEFYWTQELIFARLYMWFKVFIETKLIHKNYSDNWDRIESTK